MGRDARADDGASTVEFVALALVLLLPIVALVVTLTRVQSGAYAAEAAAYAAARSAVVSGLDAIDAGRPRADAAARAEADATLAAVVVAEDFGLDAAPEVELACDGECLAPGTVVTARVTVEVALPGVPTFVRAIIPTTVPVEAVASSPVDGYAP